jgi:tetratricopeptide (TPR) repeat protein
MFHIVPLFLIIISLGVIVVVIARKYPELTLLDLDTIPDRKEKQKKRELLSRKASKRSKEQQEQFLHRLEPVKRAWKNTQTSFRTYVKQLKDDVESKKQSAERAKDTKLPSVEKSVQSTGGIISDIIKKGKRAIEEKKFQEAESLFIRAIEHDQKSVDAYEGLGDVYSGQQQIEEAKETYLYAKKLDPQNVSVLVKLASLAEEDEAWVKAIQYYEEAVLIEDTNAVFFATLAELFLKTNQKESSYEAISQAVELHPKHLPYLDSLVEISIMMQDKNRAEEAVQAIRMVNPNYTRLGVIKERVAEMGDA